MASTPISPVSLFAPKPGPAKYRKLCTDCGLSRMKSAELCGQACQFIAPDYPQMEGQVHGASKPQLDAAFFGQYLAMHRAKLRAPLDGAQWTGITTKLAEQLLAKGIVDAVLTVAPDPADKWKPMPVLVTKPEDMAAVRGMRMGYAPLLSLLEPAAEAGHKNIAIIGIPCQIYALRAIEETLGFDRLYVIGTPCSDNTTTENFHEFLGLLDEAPDTITYLEFRADYRVELRFEDGRTREVPFLKLPISDLPSDFFPITCRTCVDYTNRLSDITVGYMAGQGNQWLIVRNKRGQEILDLLGDDILLETPSSKGKRAGAVKGFMENTKLAAGGLPLRRMPNWLRPIVSWLQPRIGPRGLEFGRARVEMKAIETILHLRQHHPKRVKSMVPDHVWDLVAPYGLTRTEDETRPDP